MQYRRFGATTLRVSEIGFGAWAIGGGTMIGETAIGWGHAEDAVSLKAIRAAREAGINFFDTADIYGLGHSEALLGQTLGNDPDVVIASKGGNVARDGRFTVDYSAHHLYNACEDSLRRLRRDAIDFYQLHTARLSHLQQAGCIEAMQRLQEQGKVRYWGLSLNTFDPLPEARYLMEQQQGQGFQLVLNLINHRGLPLLPEAAAHGYGLIARMPLQFGLLTGKFDASRHFEASDHRKKRITSELVKAAQNSLAPVWSLCEKYGCSKTSLAISYILSYPEISVVIPGIRTAEQVTANTSGLVQLNAADRQLIEETGRGAAASLMQLIQDLG